MPRKKVDNRIRVQIENGVAAGHRSLFVVVGEKARDQVRRGHTGPGGVRSVHGQCDARVLESHRIT